MRKQIKTSNTIETTCFGKCSELKRTRTTHLLQFAWNSGCPAICFTCTRCGDQNTEAERKIKWRKYLNE